MNARVDLYRKRVRRSWRRRRRRRRRPWSGCLSASATASTCTDSRPALGNSFSPASKYRTPRAARRTATAMCSCILSPMPSSAHSVCRTLVSSFRTMTRNGTSRCVSHSYTHIYTYKCMYFYIFRKHVRVCACMWMTDAWCVHTRTLCFCTRACVYV